MYRTSTQEPRYKPSLYEREPRHVESKESSVEYTSSSEEEEESSEKFTEESDEETIETQESYSLQKRSEWSPVSEQQWSYNKLEKPDQNITNPYICDTRIYKQDKVTQKNLLSPFPSFVIPPIPRQVVGPPHYRLPNVRPHKEEQNNLKSSTNYCPKKNKNYREEENMTCVIHKNYDSEERKVSQKPKVQKDQAFQSKVCSSDRFFKCLPHKSPEVSSRNFSKSTAETEKFPKQSMSISKDVRRPKSSTRENASNQQTMTKFDDCTFEHETRDKSRPKTAIGVIPCEKDAYVRETFLARNIGDGKLTNKRGGEVKEKLMYVVEEEGKEVTKLETDLFTLNEILAIKRDLIELSEFAKKLKKLKEMKKESEDAKNKESMCQCKPAEELLKDVNRRIEILEVRQEELERGSSKSGQKGDTETESKNTNVTKISSGLPAKTPAVIQSTATTTDPGFPKTKILVPKPEGFSNNSDVVKELMDIKTQLQRLEKRRISKEVSNEIVPEESRKPTANKNRAIAIFSSKTYIFATENFDKKKIAEKTKRGEKGRNFTAPVEKNTTKSEQKKANVASWLKNVKIEQTETDVSLFLSTEKLKRKENNLEELKGNANVKCKNCVQALKVRDFENQEPRKNRMLETDDRKDDSSFAKWLKKKSSISEINRHIGYKKCVMTPSGRLFPLMSQSSENILNVQSAYKLRQLPGANLQWLPSRTISRNNSSGSIASAILTKQQVWRLKEQTRKDNHCKGLIPCPTQSKSLQDLSLNSNFCKVEKIAQNMNMKNFGKVEAPFLPQSPKKISGRKNKEEKNEFVQHLEAHLIALKNNFEKRDPTTSSCTYSEFLASINLDSEKTSAIVESSTLQKNIANNEIYTYMASTKTNLKALDSQNRQEQSCRENKKKKERKQKPRKEEKTEEMKSELKKKSKPKKEKKCKEPRRQKKCKKKKKHEQQRCKCENINYSNFWKSYYRDECLKYNEEKPTSNHPKISSEDNFKLYRKQETERCKTNLDCKKSIVDSFTIRNIFKNLGRYYPKISNFHLFPFPRGEFCDSKQEEHTKLRHSKTSIINKSEEQEDENDYDDEDNEEDEDVEDDENDEDCSQTSNGSYSCPSVRSIKHSDQGHHRYYYQTTMPEDLKNCKCVQVYLQTQKQCAWSGFEPFRLLSAECTTNESTSVSAGSYNSSAQSELLFPSQIQYVGHSTQKREKNKPKCDKKPTEEKKPNQKKHNICVCCKCGHIHKLKKKKRKKSKCKKCSQSKCKKCPKSQCSKCSKPKTPPETPVGSESEFTKHCSCGGKPPSETSPLFSFLSNFCKAKPRESKPGKSIIKKISETRYLKTCPRMKINFFSKLRNHLPASRDQKSRSRQNSCCCISKLQDIENKLKKLEKKKSCCDHGKKDEEETKKKEKEKKECYCTNSYESKDSGPGVECLCCEDEKKKAVKSSQKKKKKKHKKQKMECCCSESKKEDQKCTGAYYCTIECLSSDITSKVSTLKTTEEEEEKRKKEIFSRATRSKEFLEQTNTRLKEKCPYLKSFLEDIQNYKVTKSESGIKNLTKIKTKKPLGLLEPGAVFLGDCSKNGSRARRNQGYEVKEDPVTFLKEIKKCEKKANEKEKKEKRTPKPKPRNRSKK